MGEGRDLAGAGRTEPKHRVLIVDDRADIRVLLRTRLEFEPDIEVVGEASNGDEAVQLSSALAPAAVVLDLDMPAMSGEEAIPLMRAVAPGMGIVVYTATSEDRLAFTPEATPDATAQKGMPLAELVRVLHGVLETAPFDVMRLELGRLPLRQAITAFDTWAGLNVRVLEALKRADDLTAEQLGGATPEELEALMGVYAHIGNNLQKAARAGSEDVLPVIHVFRRSGVLARHALIAFNSHRLPGFWNAWGYEVPGDAVNALTLMRERLLEVLPVSSPVEPERIVQPLFEVSPIAN